MFGHQIALNFEKKGDSHKTFVGGFISIIVKAGLIAYVAICCKRMLLQERDATNTNIGS